MCQIRIYITTLSQIEISSSLIVEKNVCLIFQEKTF